MLPVFSLEGSDWGTLEQQQNMGRNLFFIDVGFIKETPKNKDKKWSSIPSLSESASSNRYTQSTMGARYPIDRLIRYILYLEADSVVVTIDTLPLTFIFVFLSANIAFLCGMWAIGDEIASAAARLG